ncbi:MAG: hypothetical protein PUB21_08010 [Bacteroidales bacterium]|nr:hypothetical protein [Bacteroidales bacterium]
MEYEKIEVYDPLTEKGDTGESSAGKLNRNFERAASLDDLNNIPAVLYNRDQDLTDTQQEQARKNIGAGVTQRRNGYLSMGDINNAPDQNIGPYGVWIESEEYGIIFQYQAPVGVGNPSITYQMAINPGYGWRMRQYSSVNKVWTDWVNIGIGSGSVRYDTQQDLDSSEMEQALFNVGLQNFKGGLLISDLSEMNKINPEWWCWGETDFIRDPEADEIAKDNNFFWLQSSRIMNDELETSQTRINGRRLQRRTKLGRSTSWEGIVWEDIDSSPEDKPYYVELNEIETLSSPEIEDRIGGWDNLRRAIIKGRNINAIIDASGQWVELTGKNQGNYTIVLTDVNSTDDIKTVWKINKSQTEGTLTALKETVELTVSAATTENYGTVILGKGLGDNTDSGKVPALDSDGKIPNANLRDAFNNASEGGIVKVTYNGGTMDKYKVPFVGDNGVLSPYVLPEATNEEKGAVTLASNTGNSTDNGKVPVLGADGKLNVNTLPAGLSPAPVNGRLYVGKDGTWVQDSNFVNAYNNTDGYLVNTDIIAGESDVLGVTFQIIGNQYSASTGFSGIPYFCVIQAYWHGINNTFYDPACIALGNAANFNNITVFRRLVDGSYRICIRFESKQYNNFSVAAYANNDVSGRNRVTNISSSAVPSDAISTKNVSVRVGYNDTNANLSTVDWNANHLITEGWVRFGGEINFRPPETGGWGSGMYFRKKSDNSNLAAIGAVFYEEVFSKFYIGWGTNPLNPATGLAIGENAFTYKGQNIWHAGNLGDATTTKAGLVVLADNTGNSTDNGKVPVLGANGKLNANVIPSGSTTRFIYTVYSNDIGSEVHAMLRIIGAKDAIFAATVEVLGYGTRIYDNAGTTMYQSFNLKKTVEIYSSCYENGDESFLSSAYKINGKYVGNLTYDGNDILIDVGNLLTYTENDINRYTSVTRNIINETN